MQITEAECRNYYKKYGDMMEALSVYKDGTELKVVKMSLNKGEFTLLQADKIQLYSKSAENKEEILAEEAVDAFGNIGDGDEIVLSEEKAREHDLNIIFNLAARITTPNTKVALNAQEHEVSSLMMKKVLSGKRKKDRAVIYEELQNVNQSVSQFDFLALSDDTQSVWYQNENISLFDSFQTVNKHAHKKVNLSSIDVNEMSLVNLFCMINGTPEGLTALIYTGSSFSRIIFFEDGNVCHISQTINSGLHSKNLESDIFAKLLFELDSLERDDLSAIYISGDKPNERLITSLTAKLQDTDIKALNIVESLGYSNNVTDVEIDGFAIPIAMAYKALNPKQMAVSGFNFLPKNIRDQQEIYRIDWHGYATLAVTAASLLLFAFQYQQYSKSIDRAHFEQGLIQEQIASQQEIAKKIDEMDTQLKRYREVAAVMDSLQNKSNSYSDIMSHFSKQVKDINSFWMTNLYLKNDGFSITGTSLYRSRIHQFAQNSGNALVMQTERQEIRKFKVYQFDINGDPGKLFPGENLLQKKMGILELVRSQNKSPNNLVSDNSFR